MHEKTTAVDVLNSVRSLHFDKIPRTNCPDLLSNAFGSLQQRGNVPESESILHVNLKKRFLQNLHVRRVHKLFLTRGTFDNIRANVRVKWEALGHPNTEARGRTSTLQTCVKRKTGLQATDERALLAFPHVFLRGTASEVELMDGSSVS